MYNTINNEYFLIQNLEQFNFVKKKYPTSKFVFINNDDYSIDCPQTIYFFYNFLKPHFSHKYLESLINLSLNWYRDENGYDLFYENGFSVCRINFRGVEKSDGIFDNGQGELSDAAAALDWIEKENPGFGQCWVSGFSFGALI